MRVRISLVAASLLAGAAAHAQSTSFDGTYRGEAAGGGCSVMTPVLRVKQGVATLRYNPSITFEGNVAADGGLNTQYGAATFSGKFTGPKFQGDLISKGCHYTLTLAK